MQTVFCRCDYKATHSYTDACISADKSFPIQKQALLKQTIQIVFVLFSLDHDNTCC